MIITTYSNFRQNLKTLLDEIFTLHTPLYVKRKNHEDVVVLAKSDYESLQETLYLLGNQKNAKRLLNGIEKYKAGEFTEHHLIEE